MEDDRPEPSGSHSPFDPYDYEWLDKMWRDAGQEPPWTRIFADGVDVTDDPSRWPKWKTDPESLRRPRRKGRRGRRSFEF